jgi:hypothetical protein
MKAAVLLLVALVALPQEKLESSRHPWLKFKVGTSVAYTITSEMGALRQEGRLTHVLKEAKDGAYTVEVKVAQLGIEQTLEEKDSLPVKVGQEKLTVAGKELACTVWESKGTRGPHAASSKVWLAEGIATPVKIIAKVEGQEENEMTAAAFEEKVTAAGKEYACARLEGKSKGPLGEAQATVWVSDQVPGGLVKMVGKGKVQGALATTTLELAGVSEKK